ncbi:ABC transporter substrate-binding protein [Fusobacterium sp. oral taxon 203]|uniref:ABC transporter substrate-binding protein n=1 Tax=Fusobacterium sp. oral taxon 203 TaxID=671211 RepID=UPI000B92CEB5|nr:ABC transporter substrate-binding protein [Fusobacterium sp. oral taxon 203]ASS38695.1 hemin receptor [Fusobacterium sp. oral taxon 203]
MKKIFLLIFLIENLVFAKTPQRAVSISHFTTEILLSIGAENQMVGTAYLDMPILPELKDRFEKIPILSDKFPTKELFYSVRPDFVTGWEGLVKSRNLGPKKELEENGVQVYIFKSLNDERIEVLYSDILELGKIFKLEKNARELVEKIKKELSEIKKKVPKQKKKVLVCDPGDDQPFVLGGKGIGNYIIELAGAENVTAEINKAWGYSTWEKIIVSNPEYILIPDYEGRDYEEKVKYLKNESPIKDLKAIKENKIIKIDLAGISPGVRISTEAKKIAEKLHGIKF